MTSHFGKARRRTLICGAAIAAVLAATPALAQEQLANIDIAAQPMDQALKELAKQSGANLLFSPDAVRGLRAKSLQTTATPEEAARMLLAGTDLLVKKDATGSLLVDRADPQSGSAAGDGADAGTVQALIVTAQKREEDIQDVPIAISAFTQEDLTRSQVAGGPDLVTQIPNFTFTKTNFSGYSIQIRGIGTQAISATTDPAVAVAFNNTPFIRNRFFEQEFYDLERVEVLRGPQGTLYGRNATAGVVNIISAKPKFRYEAKLSGDIGNFSSSRLEGMVNIPLVEDKAALRIAGAWTKRDGYATNQITGNPIDGRDLWSTRVSLRVQPTDRFNMNLIWEHFQEDDDRLRSGKQLCKKDVVTHVGDYQVTSFDEGLADRGQGASNTAASMQSTFSQGCAAESLYSPDSFQTPNGQSIPYYFPLGAIGLPRALLDPYVSEVQSPNLRVIESTVDPKYRAKSDLGEAQISFDLTDTLTLSSETAYSRDQVWSTQDFNRFNTAPGAWLQPNGANRPGVPLQGPNGGIFCDPQIGCSDRLVAIDLSTARASQFSQEFRLASDFGGPFNFSLGANFLRADSEDKYYVFINSLTFEAATSLASKITTPYVMGQSDNSDCLPQGYLPGDPNGAYPVQACTYIDPNPITSLNDQGHNYFLSKNPYKLISYAVFGEAYYDITDTLKLTGGLRWTVDKKEAPRIPTWVLSSNSVGYPVAEVIEQEWREPTGRLTLNWKPDLAFTDETMLYGSFAHGYKAGGANPPGFVRVYYGDITVAQANSAASATRPRTFAPEFVNAFELGAKNTLLDGRATLNLAGFYYDYTGYQVSEIVDRSAFNRNFDATVWGLELESDWRPLENLRLGLKLGYEKTRIADGEKAVDLMDRTAGMPGWSLVRPFPTLASSCILPTWLYLVFAGNNGGRPMNPGNANGGGPAGCELAYGAHVDPWTGQPYTPNPFGGGSPYPGFDPLAGTPGDPYTGQNTYNGVDYGPVPNNGEGFDKQLGGNELPNAPHYTATVTGDYTVPLANDWLMTLHSDVHWQSQSWWRVFNDKTFDKLHPYFTMNLAAIFTNEDAGWNIMAYIKNVTDETAITGAFLNSDDTGLTTNVFLTEPRLYGVRVTKAWTGGSLLGSFGERHDGPYPFTLELVGQAQRIDAPTQTLMPSYASAFAAPLDIFDDAQDTALDWGQGGDVKLTWRPSEGSWAVVGGFRYGHANGKAQPAAQWATPTVCLYGSTSASVCGLGDLLDPQTIFFKNIYYSRTNRADATANDGESYAVVDLAVQRDLMFGGLSESSVGLGLRYLSLDSTTEAELKGIPDWHIVAGSFRTFGLGGPITHTLYNINVSARREFTGLGPVLSWDADYTLMQLPEAGQVGLDWSMSGGAVFGTQKTSISGSQQARTYSITTANRSQEPGTLTGTTAGSPVAFQRSEEVTVPVAGASLGVAYKVGGFKVGAGYRWERYFNAIDGGYAEKKEEDRTIDGPYFKVSVGFGG